VPEIYTGDDELDLSVVLPCYNEEQAIQQVVGEIREALTDWQGRWEILAVDDASTDRTVERAEALGVRIVRRVENGGAGASRKTGIAAARGKLVAMLDVDGTYVPAHLPELLSYCSTYDQVNGARTSEQGTMKLLRTPAKWLIRKLAEWVSNRPIPDLNTGMKVFKRDVMRRYTWVIPDGFSCVTSMTLAFLCNGHPVKYVPVEYRKRIGKSKFHPLRDTALYAATVMRVIMYFRPLRIFGPLASGLFVVALAKGYYSWRLSGKGTLQESDIILAVGAVIVLVLGLLADLIVAQRRATS